MSEPSSVGEAGGQADATLAEVTVKVEHRAATPIAGAVAGILFAVFFAVSIMTITSTMADVAHDTGAWLELGAGRVQVRYRPRPLRRTVLPLVHRRGSRALGALRG